MFFCCVVCEECQDLHYGDCPVHGPLQVIVDRTMEGNSNLSSAVASLPPVLKISQSSIPGAGLGVFSASEIPKGVRFGPYKGKKIGWEHISDETNTSYMWEVVLYYIIMQSNDNNYLHNYALWLDEHVVLVE